MSDQNADFMNKPLEQFTVAELTDALGVAKSADLLGTTRRAIYTMRNTNRLGVDRIIALIAEIQKDEVVCRQRLTILRRQRPREAATA